MELVFNKTNFLFIVFKKKKKEKNVCNLKCSFLNIYYHKLLVISLKYLTEIIIFFQYFDQNFKKIIHSYFY